MDKELKRIQEAIDDAFRNSKIFYKPWLGYQYCEGLNLDENRPLKTLVIGASRYCQSEGCREINCHFFTDPALLRQEYEAQSKCRFVSMDRERGGYHTDYDLSNINTASILTTKYKDETGGGYIPRAYRFFANKVGGDILCMKKTEELWNRIAFVNYLQLITPKETPSYSGVFCKYYRDSCEIIKKIILMLEPDCILLWTPRVFREAKISNLFPGAREDRNFTVRVDTLTKRKGRQYFKYRVPIEGRAFTLLTCPHPTECGGKRTLQYFEAVREERQTFGYTTFQYSSPSHYETRTVERKIEDYDDWEDFKEVFLQNLYDFITEK